MTLDTKELALPCSKCGRAVVVEIVEPRILNTPESSLVVIVHDKRVDCPHCRTCQSIMLAGIAQGGYVFRLVEVQRKVDTPQIVIPGRG